LRKGLLGQILRCLADASQGNHGIERCNISQVKPQEQGTIGGLPNLDYVFSQQARSPDEDKITQVVEKYGSGLKYSEQRALNDMVDGAASGDLPHLQHALENGSPASRAAFAEIMRKEMGLDVQVLEGSEKSPKDFTFLIHSANDGVETLRLNYDSQANGGWGSWDVSKGYPNGKGPVNFYHPRPDDNWIGRNDPNSAADFLKQWQYSIYTVYDGPR
jgi:hypothetical protein